MHSKPFLSRANENLAYISSHSPFSSSIGRHQPNLCPWICSFHLRGTFHSKELKGQVAYQSDLLHSAYYLWGSSTLAVYFLNDCKLYICVNSLSAQGQTCSVSLMCSIHPFQWTWWRTRLVYLALFWTLFASLLQLNCGPLKALYRSLKLKLTDVLIFCSISAGRFKSLFPVQD